jgi:hypothetical protein
MYSTLDKRTKAQVFCRQLFSVHIKLYNVHCTVYVQQISSANHRDTYLEQKQTEKIETEVRDVDRIRITKVYACCPGWPSWGVIQERPSQT